MLFKDLIAFLEIFHIGLQAFLQSPALGCAWVGMLFTSMAYPVLATLLLAAIWLLAARHLRVRRRIAYPLLGLAPVIVMATAATLGSFTLTTVPARPSASALRLAHLNSYYYANPKSKAAFVHASQADVISLVEVNPTFASKLASTTTLPYHTLTRAAARPNNLPMALLSRWPIVLEKQWSPRMVLYRVQHPTNPFHVLQLHIKSPFSGDELLRRNTDLASIPVSTLPHPLLVVGDLNTVPWDPALQHLLGPLKLAASLAPTWPSTAPLAPIDHLLTSPGITKPAIHHVAVKSTDHLAIIADFPTLPK